MQERLRPPHYGWKMLVACVLLNRTHGRVARDVIFELLRRWPSPIRLWRADPEEVRRAIRPLGLWRRRADTLVRLSTEWCCYPRRRSPWSLPGCGEYARDSWRIFVLGQLPRRVSDGKLRAYLRWKKRASAGKVLRGRR